MATGPEARKTRLGLKGAAALVRVTARLAISAVEIWWGRRTAVRAFRQSLQETGMDPASAADLARAFPSLDLRNLTGR